MSGGEWLEDGFFCTPTDRPLTAEERLSCGLRLIDKAKREPGFLREIAVFEHGTIVIVLSACPVESAVDVMRRFNFPLDGEGGAPGDISLVPFDDGSLMYDWSPAINWLELTGCVVISVVGPAERKDPEEPMSPSPTEVFQTGGPMLEKQNVIDFLVGRECRHARTLDARNPVVVARWTCAEEL